MRAAHSLAAHPDISEVVVIGPATSKSFQVVDDADGLDVLVGSGEKAPAMARDHNTPLIWDGNEATAGGCCLGWLATRLDSRPRQPGD